MSYREQLIDIISMAQHASPNVTGQIDERRAHCTIFSTVVVRTGISDSMPMEQSSVASPQSPVVSPQSSVLSRQSPVFSRQPLALDSQPFPCSLPQSSTPS